MARPLVELLVVVILFKVANSLLRIQYIVMISRYWLMILVFLPIGFLSSCNTINGIKSPVKEVAILARENNIQNEGLGDYFIGRRYYVNRMRFWGYLRRPGQPWSESVIVIMNEKVKTVPDRLPEIMDSEVNKLGDDPTKLIGIKRFGFDHNFEYKIKGNFSGSKVYDPNSNMYVREFILTDYELINSKPGWLFSPNETYDCKVLPKFRGR